jgi:hypothetical protein
MPPTPTEPLDPQELAGRPVYIVDPLTGERVNLVGGALPTTGSGGGGGTVDQGAPAVPANAWPVKPTDAAGVNQQAITAAGDAKVTLDGEQPQVKIVDSGGVNVLSVNGSGQLGVTGFVSVPGVAQAATQTDGSQVTKICDATIPSRLAKVTTAGNLQIAISASTSTVSIAGTQTENAPQNNLPTSAMTGKANAAAPTWGENNYVPLSVNLAGALRDDPVDRPARDMGKIDIASLDQYTPGQQPMASSLPVVIANNQSAVPVSAASLPLPTGSATEAKQDVGNLSLSSLDSKIGTLESKPSAYSVLDRLYQIGVKLDAITKALAPVVPPAPVLRHPLRRF